MRSFKIGSIRILVVIGEVDCLIMHNLFEALVGDSLSSWLTYNDKYLKMLKVNRSYQIPELSQLFEARTICISSSIGLWGDKRTMRLSPTFEEISIPLFLIWALCPHVPLLCSSLGGGRPFLIGNW